MRLLAQIGMKLDVADDAEFLLENVLALAPDYHAARYEYAVALLKRHKHVRARRGDGETARNRSEQPSLPDHLCDGLRGLRRLQPSAAALP